MVYRTLYSQGGSVVLSLLELLYAQLARTRPATSLHQSAWLTIYFARVVNDTTPNQFESTRVYSAARSQDRVLLHIRGGRSRAASSISRARIRSVVPRLPIRPFGQLAHFFPALRQYRPVDQLVPN
jgi:hypothetical protein